MTDDLLALRTETEAALDAAADLRAWDAVRVGVLGKQGRLTLESDFERFHELIR